jgi:hypothetical protein
LGPSPTARTPDNDSSGICGRAGFHDSVEKPSAMESRPTYVAMSPLALAYVVGQVSMILLKNRRLWKADLHTWRCRPLALICGRAGFHTCRISTESSIPAEFQLCSSVGTAKQRHKSEQTHADQTPGSCAHRVDEQLDGSAVRAATSLPINSTIGHARGVTQTIIVPILAAGACCAIGWV